MTLTVLEAEFPAWHLLCSFDVFHLGGRSENAKRGLGREEALKKLAKVFEVNEVDLRTQFVSILPTAEAFQKRSGLDNRSAWAKALNRLDTTSQLRRKYPASALREARNFCVSSSYVVIITNFCHTCRWCRTSLLGQRLALAASKCFHSSSAAQLNFRVPK